METEHQVHDTSENGALSADDPIASLLDASRAQALSTAKEALKKRILNALYQQAVEELGAPDVIARQAMQEHVDAEHDTVVNARTSLKERLLETVAQQATDDLGSDTKASARQAHNYVSQNDDVILSTKARLKEQLLEQILNQAIGEINEEVSTSQEDDLPL